MMTMAHANLDKNQKYWLSTYEVQKNPRFPMKEIIKSPKGTYQNILSLFYYDSNQVLRKDCLIYYVPSEEKPGELKIISLNKFEKCEENFFTATKRTYQNIFNFTYELKDKELTLFVDEKEYQFTLEGMDNKSPLFLSLIESHSGTKLSEGDLCYDVDDQCQVIKKDTCHLCPGKITQVVASGCQNDFRKYCLSKPCGKKQAPACIRGFKATGVKEKYCFVGSPVGFCRKPNRVYCENSELICR
jgi:hypothetical protein